MKAYMVQVTLGCNFADLTVFAANDVDAIAAAKELVKTDVSYKLFRHRFANFIL